jgi:hypothetical protein
MCAEPRYHFHLFLAVQVGTVPCWIDPVRKYPAEGMKAWRVVKLQGDGTDLLELLADLSRPTQTTLHRSASQGEFPFVENH